MFIILFCNKWCLFFYLIKRPSSCSCYKVNDSFIVFITPIINNMIIILMTIYYYGIRTISIFVIIF